MKSEKEGTMIESQQLFILKGNNDEMLFSDHDRAPVNHLKGFNLSPD